MVKKGGQFGHDAGRDGPDPITPEVSEQEQRVPKELRPEERKSKTGAGIAFPVLNGLHHNNCQSA
jgi:hypothetical protein